MVTVLSQYKIFVRVEIEKYEHDFMVGQDQLCHVSMLHHKDYSDVNYTHHLHNIFTNFTKK